MELVKTESALLFMFYQVLMENLITIHFPNLRQNVANFPNWSNLPTLYDLEMTFVVILSLF